MTTTQNAHRFSPIFVATVTPASVSTRTGKNGKYALMQGATVQYGETRKEMTVMAFGKSRDEVASKLRKGRPVDLAVQFDGGTMKVIGFPLEKNQPANDTVAAAA